MRAVDDLHGRFVTGRLQAGLSSFTAIPSAETTKPVIVKVAWPVHFPTASPAMVQAVIRVIDVHRLILLSGLVRLAGFFFSSGSGKAFSVVSASLVKALLWARSRLTRCRRRASSLLLARLSRVSHRFVAESFSASLVV